MSLPNYVLDPLSSIGWMEWSNNIGVVGLIALFSLVILHMLAIFFQLEKFKNWIKGEYLQVIITFLAVFIMLKTIQIGWSIMLNIVKEIYLSNPYFAEETIKRYGDIKNIYFDPFEFSQTLLKENYIGCQKTLYMFLYYINWFWRIKGSLKIEAQGSEALGGWYSTAFSSQIEYLMARLTQGILLNWIQITFLAIIKYVAPLLIQIGLILRIIPYSRGAGAFLIAAGIGFFAVYPISIALMLTLQPPGVACNKFTPPPILQEVVDSGELDPAQLYQQINFISLGSQNEKEKISYLQSFISIIYLQGIVFPIVSLTIVFTFIRQLSNIMGADLNEIGRGLIKLI
ncbi:MAG: hypothetical protein QXV64_02855 [Candidatus Anstonellaceae archaeon]